jgi:hypothetical protein
MEPNNMPTPMAKQKKAVSTSCAMIAQCQFIPLSLTMNVPQDAQRDALSTEMASQACSTLSLLSRKG